MSIESLIESNYTTSVDSRLTSYDAYVQYQLQEASRVLPFLSVFFSPIGAQVLEIGAGRGGKGIAFAQAGMRVTSLDVDQPSLKIAADSARAHESVVQFLAADGAKLPFPSDYFDAIFLDSVLEHTYDPSLVLTECNRVLKAGGLAYVVFPPWFGPLSGHIDDYVMIPWFHLLPRKIVERYLLARTALPGILTTHDAVDVYLTLNHLTIYGFRRMVRQTGLSLVYQRARPFLTHAGMRLVAGVISAARHPPRASKLGAALGRACREFSIGTFFLFLFLGAITPLVFVPVLQEFAAGGFKCVLKKTGRQNGQG